MKGGSEGQTEKRGQKRKRMGGHYRKYIHTPRLLPSREKQMTLEMHLPLHCPDFISFHISYIYIYNIFHFELVIFYIMVREYKMQLTLRHPTFCTRHCWDIDGLREPISGDSSLPYPLHTYNILPGVQHLREEILDEKFEHFQLWYFLLPSHRPVNTPTN